MFAKVVAPDQWKSTWMSKHAGARNRTSLWLRDGFVFLIGMVTSLLLVLSFSSFYIPLSNINPEEKLGCVGDSDRLKLNYDPPNRTFYDDPEVSYSIEKPIKNWDQKRKRWLELHPSFVAGSEDRILMVTGSQSAPCKNPIGDHLLLRCFKNKVDYSRIHGIDIFYNNAMLHPKMNSYWVKLPVIRAAMVAHPEAEWIWWVDSDAIVTDMDFKLPLHRYRHHNMVVHGWANLIYEKQSWTAVNAGVFLIRNCQWSLDFMDVWASMGPMGPEYKKWGPIQKSIFKDKMFPESDDQTALIYLLYKNREKYGNKIYLEAEYAFQGYWIGIVGGLENVTRAESSESKQRRHAEKVTETYGGPTETVVRRRSFVTHFTGCQPCSGTHNEIYEGDTCWTEMRRALNFGDNQVMRRYGFVHKGLLDDYSPLDPLPSDYPDDDGDGGSK